MGERGRGEEERKVGIGRKKEYMRGRTHTHTRAHARALTRKRTQALTHTHKIMNSFFALNCSTAFFHSTQTSQNNITFLYLSEFLSLLFYLGCENETLLVILRGSVRPSVRPYVNHHFTDTGCSITFIDGDGDGDVYEIVGFNSNGVVYPPILDKNCGLVIVHGWVFA